MRLRPASTLARTTHQIGGDLHVLDGELDLRCGARTVRGGPGTCVFVPSRSGARVRQFGTATRPHASDTRPTGPRNTRRTARSNRQRCKPDPDALAKLRAKYDTVQLARADTRQSDNWMRPIGVDGLMAAAGRHNRKWLPRLPPRPPKPRPRPPKRHRSRAHSEQLRSNARAHMAVPIWAQKKPRYVRGLVFRD